MQWRRLPHMMSRVVFSLLEWNILHGVLCSVGGLCSLVRAMSSCAGVSYHIGIEPSNVRCF